MRRCSNVAVVVQPGIRDQPDLENIDFAAAKILCLLSEIVEKIFRFRPFRDGLGPLLDTASVKEFMMAWYVFHDLLDSGVFEWRAQPARFGSEGVGRPPTVYLALLRIH